MIGESIMGLVQNLKRTLTNWVDKILVELSCLYIKQVAKQTSKKQDNSLHTESLPNHLTEEPSAPIVEEPTSEKTTMMETEEIVSEVREWAISKVQEYNEMGIERIYDQMAIMEEFDEWFDPKEDLEVVSLEEISEEEYDDFVENNDGIGRG